LYHDDVVKNSFACKLDMFDYKNKIKNIESAKNVLTCTIKEDVKLSETSQVASTNENVIECSKNSNMLDLKNVTKSVNMLPNIPNVEKVHIKGNQINIVSWNIQGIYEKFRESDLVSFLFASNDIIILTETHANIKTEYDFPNFHYLNYARKHVHPNAPGPSGGIGIFIRDSLYEGVHVYSYNECIVWVQLSKTYYGGLKDKLIACCYFPPDGSSYIHNTIENTDYFNILQSELAKHGDTVDVYICGDLNARTGSRQEYVYDIPGNDGDIENLIPSHHIVNVENICHRASQDKVENEYGKELITLLEATGLRIMNGRIHKDKGTGKLTCHKYNGSSVVDYLITSPQCICSILDFEILDKRPESDHMPVSFTLDVLCLPFYQPNIESGRSLTRYKWDPKKLPEYLYKLSSETTVTLYEHFLCESIDPNVSSDVACDLFYKYIMCAIASTFKTSNSSTLKKQFPNNKWFDNECKQYKSIAHGFSNRYDISIEPHRSHYNSLISEYNRIKQMKKRNHKKNLRENLENLQSTNPQVYWRLWKSMGKRSNVINSTLTLGEHGLYYKGQVFPPSVPYFDISSMSEV
jgi:exonuclease III